MAVTHAGSGIERGGSAYYSRDITTLAVNPANPSVLFAGTTHSGVFKSTDSGDSWTDVNAGLTTRYINKLVIDPVETSTLYAATTSEVFKSTDAGGTWTAASSGLTGRTSVRTLVVDRARPTTLYAGTYGPTPTDPGGVVFKSSNSGGTWTTASAGLTSGVNALSINPADGSILYAGALAGIFKSTDSGGTWASASVGLADRPPIVTSLAIDPLTPTTLYAGTYGGVFRSTDSGGTWARSSKGLVDNVYDVVQALVATPSCLYAGFEGVYRSVDSGRTWAGGGSGPMRRNVLALAVNPANPSILYAGADFNDIFSSSDGGATWVTARKGLPVFSLPKAAK